jgi:hypothetical protein
MEEDAIDDEFDENMGYDEAHDKKIRTETGSADANIANQLRFVNGKTAGGYGRTQKLHLFVTLQSLQ